MSSSYSLPLLETLLSQNRGHQVEDVGSWKTCVQKDRMFLILDSKWPLHNGEEIWRHFTFYLSWAVVVSHCNDEKYRGDINRLYCNILLIGVLFLSQRNTSARSGMRCAKYMMIQGIAYYNSFPVHAVILSWKYSKSNSQQTLCTPNHYNAWCRPGPWPRTIHSLFISRSPIMIHWQCKR
jgi:hypothetical protein